MFYSNLYHVTVSYQTIGFGSSGQFVFQVVEGGHSVESRDGEDVSVAKLRNENYLICFNLARDTVCILNVFQLIQRIAERNKM